MLVILRIITFGAKEPVILVSGITRIEAQNWFLKFQGVCVLKLMFCIMVAFKKIEMMMNDMIDDDEWWWWMMMNDEPRFMNLSVCLSKQKQEPVSLVFYRKASLKAQISFIIFLIIGKKFPFWKHFWDGKHHPGRFIETLHCFSISFGFHNDLDILMY